MNILHRKTIYPLFIALGLFAGQIAGTAAEPTSFSFDPQSPSQVDAAALKRFQAPLDATILAEALTSPRAPKQSYTSGTGRYGAINAFNPFHGGFEPMAFRPKFRATAADPDNVMLSPDHANSIAEGFYDGARVRVYQAIDGKIVKIRDSVLPKGGHAASSWMHYRGHLQTRADRTDFKVAIDGSFLPNRRYWAMVRAVDTYGRMSEPSPAVSFEVAEASGQKSAEKPVARIKYKVNPPSDLALPEPPRGLRVSQQGNVLHIDWDASSTPSDKLAGYRIFFTGYDPAEHRGFALNLPSREPRPDRQIQERDIVFVDQFKHTMQGDDLSPFVDWPAKRKISSPFSRYSYQKNHALWSDGSDYPARWAFKPHDAGGPEAMTGCGQTYLEWKVEGDDLTGFPVLAMGGANQGWYPVLDAQEYTIDVWVRGSGTLQFVFTGPYAPQRVKMPYGQKASSKSKGGIPPIEIPLTDQWTRVTRTFTLPFVVEKGLGTLLVSHRGPGALHMDNLKVFRSDHPYGEFEPITHQRIRESSMRYMRTHELIKTTWGYSLDSMVGNAMGGNYSGSRARQHTFHTLLNNILKGGNISPWLQVEMCLDESEWQGFAEWLCAPYDPDKGDTPEKKPWAFKRWSMGQKEPWINLFPEFAFELANETWNQTFKPYDWDWGTPLTDGATGRNYSYGETYGLFNEYVIEQLRSSPYWTEDVDKKVRFMLCGWQAAPAFGTGAAEMSPSADLLTYAAYMGADGLGDRKVIDDFKRFYMLQWSISAIEGQSARNLENEKWLRARGRDIESGIYEHGYGFMVGAGTPKEVIEVDQQLTRGLIGAVNVLDATLTRFRYGMTDQALFTFSHRYNSSWGSHTATRFGGHAYPFTKALTLFNEQAGGGHYLRTKIDSVPTWDFPEYEADDNMHKVKRAARPQAPLVSVHPFADGDKLVVFLISRKLDNFPVGGDDGFTPASLRLPITKANKITLHRLAGDPRVDDRHKEINRVEAMVIDPKSFSGTLTVNAQTGAEERGLPPASIFCYVFEKTDIGAVKTPPVAKFVLPERAVAGEPVRLRDISEASGGGKLIGQWTLGSLGPSDERDPTATFNTARMEKIELTVTDANGLSDTLARDHFPVGLRFGENLWWPWPEDPRTKETVAGRIEDGRLHLTSGTVMGNGRRASLLHADSIFGEDFVIEAMVESVTNEKPGDPLNASGLVIFSNPRSGLGFSLDFYDPINLHASLLVGADGALRCHGAKPGEIEELLPPGSMTFPAKLRLECKGNKAVAAIRQNGGWKEIATFDLPANLGLMPAVAVGGNRTKTTAVFSNLEIRK